MAIHSSVAQPFVVQPVNLGIRLEREHLRARHSGPRGERRLSVIRADIAADIGPQAAQEREVDRAQLGRLTGGAKGATR